MSAPIVEATRGRSWSLSPNLISVWRRVDRIDHRHCAQSDQRAQRGAGVEIAVALFGIAEGQQHMRARMPMSAPGRRAHLPTARTGISPAVIRRFGLEQPAPQRDGAGRGQHQLAAFLIQAPDVGAKRGQPVAAQFAAGTSTSTLMTMRRHRRTPGWWVHRHLPLRRAGRNNEDSNWGRELTQRVQLLFGGSSSRRSSLRKPNRGPDRARFTVDRRARSISARCCGGEASL